MLELVNPKTSTAEVKILLDEKIIKQLKENGILSELAYIYFAIEVEKAENANPKICKIELEDFADRWNLKIIKVRKALIDLDNKGVIFTNEPSIIQLSLSL